MNIVYSKYVMLLNNKHANYIINSLYLYFIVNLHYNSICLFVFIHYAYLNSVEQEIIYYELHNYNVIKKALV